MPDLINANEHRIYYGKDASKIARKGQVFEGSADDAKRPGVLKADSNEGREYLDAQEAVNADSSDADALERLNNLSLLARGLSTSALRDEIDEAGHRVPGSGVARNPNQPSAGGPVAYPGVDEPNQPPPETSDTVESGGVTSGVPGHDVAHADADHLSAPAIAGRLGDQQASSDSDAVGFTSSSAEDKAAELGVTLEPGKGSGKGGRYTVADVEAAAE